MTILGPTVLKSQSFGLNFLKSEGVAGLRYYDDSLSVYTNNDWFDVWTEEPPFSLSYKNISATDWTTTIYDNESELKTGITGIRGLKNIDMKVTAPAVSNLASLFYQSNMTTCDVSKLSVANTNNFYGAFKQCMTMTSITGFNKWNTSSATSFQEMFAHGRQLENIQGIEKWNTDNLYYMPHMFYECFKLRDINLDGWNSSKVTELRFAFSYCNNLSNNSVLSIVNFCLGSKVPTTLRNLSNTNSYSIFNYTPFDNSYYTPLHSALTAAGWAY